MIRITLNNTFFSTNLTSTTLKARFTGLLQPALLVVIILIAGNTLASPPPPTIYGYILEYRLKEGGTDQYNKLFDTLKKEGLEFNLEIKPFKRVMRKFISEQETACIFPTSKNAIAKSVPELEDLPIIVSDPVDQISLRVFTRANSPKVSNIAELKNKKVALWNGLNPKLFLEGTNTIIETTPNELVRVRMLNAKRIYAILGFTPDVILAAQQLNLPAPHFDENLALFRDEGASLVCKESPQNVELIKNFNITLKKLKHNGELRRMLGPHIDIVP